MSHSLVGQSSALRRIALISALAMLALSESPLAAQQQQLEAPPIVHRIQGATERLEMTANTSRLLTLDQKIPRAQVNNREIVELTPLSPNEIQIFAKKPGVTQINLWNEQNQIHSIDVMVFGDARELAMLLRSEFPQASIRVKPLAQSVVLSGFVDRQDHVSQIIRIAEDYYPKVISHITVGGVQQISLKVKIMEVNRTKIRRLGFDFAYLNGGDFVASGVSGLLDTLAGSGGGVAEGIPTAGDFAFRLQGNNSTFLGILEALRQNNLLKILAEPTLTTVSGRPAQFQVGGEFPVLIPQSLGTVSIDFKKYGTIVDFVPIVLGNGNVRLEVRPEVSEIDPATSTSINGTSIPGLKTRRVDTGAELRPGETMAIAGITYMKIEAETKGLPWVSELPYFGVPFRRVAEVQTEIELVILVTPQVVSAVPCDQMPPCGPGSSSQSPTDCELYFKGHIEVPSEGPCGPGLPCKDCGSGKYDARVIPGDSQQFQGNPEELPTGTSASRNRNGWSSTAGADGRTFDPRTGIAIPGDPFESPTKMSKTLAGKSPAPSTSKSSTPVAKSGAGTSTAGGPVSSGSSTSSASNLRRANDSKATAVAPQGRLASASSRNESTRGTSSGASGGSSASREVGAPPATSGRYNPSKPQESRASSPAVRTAGNPGFIGPVGYDVTN